MSRKRKSARIFIVDDHPVVRRGLKDLISSQEDLEVCGEAEGAAEAMKAIEAAKPDLVVVDLKLKEGTGLDLIRQMKARSPHIRMLVSSMHEEALYAERVIRAGALGYICKDEPGDKALEAIRKVLAGKVAVSEEMTYKILQTLSGAPLESSDDAVNALSDRELQVFEMIGNGLSVREIAERLYLSPKTVEGYRDAIKRKLNLDSSRELTRRAVEWTLNRQ